ncbi:unnamed protein product [Soboliphyme baturini]|uniref:FAS1 domain-containing protein n=1 Tax=Soboliphyme baturini TaxID=241478 RepID=A0A183IWI7_9BILA|nr:unnamed protein product [Soboliphyme baturini]
MSASPRQRKGIDWRRTWSSSESMHAGVISLLEVVVVATVMSITVVVVVAVGWSAAATVSESTHTHVEDVRHCSASDGQPTTCSDEVAVLIKANYPGVVDHLAKKYGFHNLGQPLSILQSFVVK